MIDSSRIIAVVLAAGSSRRFAGSKLDASVGDAPLLLHAMAPLRSFIWHKLAIVTGDPAPASLVLHADMAHWVNDQAASGIASSIRLAAEMAERTSCAGLLIMLGDMPAVSSTTLARIRAAFAQGAAQAVTSRHPDGTWGPPVLFGRALFPALRALEGDRGARTVLEAYRDTVIEVPLDGTQAQDIDTRTDLDDFIQSSRTTPAA